MAALVVNSIEHALLLLADTAEYSSLAWFA